MKILLPIMIISIFFLSSCDDGSLQLSGKKVDRADQKPQTDIEKQAIL